METRAIIDRMGTEERLLTALVSSLHVFSSSYMGAAGGAGRIGLGGGSSKGGRTSALATGGAPVKWN